MTATNICAIGRIAVAGIMHAAFHDGRRSAGGATSRSRRLRECWWSSAGRGREGGVRAAAKERRSALVLVPNVALTLLKDLTFGIVAGCVLAAISAWFGSPQEEEDA